MELYSSRDIMTVPFPDPLFDNQSLIVIFDIIKIVFKSSPEFGIFAAII